jgi:hypothetical protein
MSKAVLANAAVGCPLHPAVRANQSQTVCEDDELRGRLLIFACPAAHVHTAAGIALHRCWPRPRTQCVCNLVGIRFVSFCFVSVCVCMFSLWKALLFVSCNCLDVLCVVIVRV